MQSTVQVAEVKRNLASAMKIMKAGQSQKTRHLNRTHRVSAGFIVERFQEDQCINMCPTKSADQAADMYTKRFVDPKKWHEQLYLNIIVDFDKFWGSQSATE